MTPRLFFWGEGESQMLSTKTQQHSALDFVAFVPRSKNSVSSLLSLWKLEINRIDFINAVGKRGGWKNICFIREVEQAVICVALTAVFMINVAHGKEVNDEEKGPRTEPWGTPVVTDWLETKSWSWTNWEQPETSDLKQSRAVWQMVICLWRRMEWKIKGWGWRLKQSLLPWEAR